MTKNNYEKPNKIIAIQIEQVYQMVSGWAVVLGTQNAFELLGGVKNQIEFDRKPNDFYGVGIIEELLGNVDSQKPKEVR